ncbi:hypothetical protein D4R87_00310 [bacterium]|nr:MAG: hypothetical protein D4R87_00310 [bacterium]
MGILYNRVCSINILKQAFKKGLKKNRKAGLDGMTWQQIGENLDDFLLQLRKELVSNIYQPMMPKKEMTSFIFNPQKTIVFDVLNTKDRIVEYAVKIVLSEIYEKVFLPFVCAYRSGRGEKYFISLVTRKIKDGYPWVAYVDIESFFKSIDIKILVNELLNFTQDKELTDIIKKCLFLNNKKKSIPLGHILSTFLSDVYLYPIDFHLRTKNVIRNADSWLFFGKDEKNFCKNIQLIQNLVSERKLSLNSEKTMTIFNPDPKKLLMI